YPTFTMMNAASFATGCYPGATGFYGNTLYAPAAGQGKNADDRPVDFSQPVFTEDYKILESLDASFGGRLLLPGTLLEVAQAAHLVTATIGKSGPAFLQDRGRGGLVVDEKHVWPLGEAKRLQAAGIPLPKSTPFAYAPGALALRADNLDPTRPGERHKLADG